MDKGIKISPKFGVNPSMTVCFWCGETTGIALLGKIGDGRKHEDFEAPRYCFGGYEPCDKCKEKMSLGVTIMEAQDSPVHEGLPAMQDRVWPTGRFAVVDSEASSRIFGDKVKDKVFVDKELFDRLIGVRNDG